MVLSSTLKISQKHHGMWRPIAFFSRKLTSTQSRYSTFDRELLAIYSAIQHFRFFLEGRPFSVLTDHKPLTYALTSKTARSPRQERQLTYIAEFTTDIRYISGTDNVVPDVLSRAPCAEQPMVASASPIPPIDLARMAEEQLRDPEVAELRKQPGALKLKEVNLDGCILLCDVSTSRPRPIVPPLWTKIIFEAIHNLSHPDHKPTTRAISARYVWPGLKREVKNMVRACHSCQASKIGRHTKTPLNSFDPPDRRFGDIHVDLVGPFPPSEGCTYLFTIIDRFTRWPEAVPIQNAEATTCATALLRTWIARFGVPDSITSDQGPQFTSGLWCELHNVLGCSNKHTTAYHPQSNGMVERFHRNLKAALKARLLGPGWMDELPIVLLGIRSTWKEDLDAAPALLTYGNNLRIPGDFFPSNSAERISPSSTFVRDLQENFRKLSLLSPVHHGTTKKYLLRDLMSAEQVYVRHDAHRGPLVRPYDGPFKVLHRSDKHFDILRNNKSTRVSIDRLKPAYSADPKFPPPAVHPYDQTPRVDDNPRSETVSDSQSNTRSGRIIKRPIRYRTILSARSF